MTFFPAGKVRWVHTFELKLLYAIVHKIKVAPVKEIYSHWLDSVKKSYSIGYTSLITRIADAVGALDGENLEFIPIPRSICDFQVLNQGHTLKKDNATGGICFFFPGYANKIQLPNPDLHLYNCGALTFDLKTAEEMRREELAARAAHAGPSMEPPHTGWMPPQDYPGYSAWEQYHQPAQSPAQAWSEAGTDEWERRRQYTVDSPHGQEDPTLHSLNERIGQLQIQTGNIEATLGDFVQSTAQWQQQYGQRFDSLEENLRLQQEQQRAFWRSQGYNPGP